MEYLLKLAIIMILLHIGQLQLMHLIISLYGALSLHNCSSSGSLVFTRLGRIN